MLNYLAMALTPYASAFNVFTYYTVRAGAAAFTSFFLCLLLGPGLIGWLRALKVGQHIKREHVPDLHNLHKGKAGTPTMGGTLIIVSTLASLLLWSNLTNPLLVVTTAVMCVLGAVGFLDDFIKLRHKHNDGLSARAKIMGQLAVGLCLGLFLYLSPITVSSSSISLGHVLDWPGLVDELELQASEGGPTPGKRFWNRLSPVLQRRLTRIPADGALDSKSSKLLIQELNVILEEPDLYDEAAWKGVPLCMEVRALLEKAADLDTPEAARMNRYLLESALPGYVPGTIANLHTKVAVPGLKDVLIPLGPLYILFVIFIIVASSNAVNLTDGLDGLAAGASTVSLLAYTGIAYVVSRVDWSHYLYLPYVPQASELTVFGAALLGAGLGFLWFNAHPAEIFMGDTGSLALGGVIGTMALLTKQELLLPLVGGLFVLEALSVVIQVASFKTTGKRVFRMAPLHHHFELMGWSETKVTIRFWIIAILFALMSIGTLKLR